MTNKVFDVEAPEAVLREATGGKKAPAVVYGGICNWDAEDLVDARESFDKIIWTPSAHGSFLLMLVLATLPQNCMLPVSKVVLSHERAVDATPSPPPRILRRASRPAPSARRRWCRRRRATPRRTRGGRAPRRWRGFGRGLDEIRTPSSRDDAIDATLLPYLTMSLFFAQMGGLSRAAQRSSPRSTPRPRIWSRSRATAGAARKRWTTASNATTSSTS